MTENLKVGDVVQLKSGGPLMTISYQSDNAKSYECKWFHNDELKRSHFSKDSLKKVEPKEGENQND